jgi:hypothetical protein
VIYALNENHSKRHSSNICPIILNSCLPSKALVSIDAYGTTSSDHYHIDETSNVTDLVFSD